LLKNRDCHIPYAPIFKDHAIRNPKGANQTTIFLLPLPDFNFRLRKNQLKPMPKPLEKLKRRWNIQHNSEILVILLVFALTGTSTVYLYSFIKKWVGITPDTFFLFKLVAFILLALPLYNLLLILWGKALGQGAFFRRFVRQFVERMLPFLRKQKK